MAHQNVPMQDKELLSDALTTQKMITGHYNKFANECSCKKLREETLNLLREEHDIQHEVFTEMHSRGWYETPTADTQKITQAKTKLQSQ